MIASRALLLSVAVVRFRIWLATALASGAIVGSLLHGQVGDEEKSRRDESEQVTASPSAKPKKSPSPVASKNKSGKKNRASATPEKVPTAIPHAKLAKEESQRKEDSSSREKKSPIPKARAAKEESSNDDTESRNAKESPSPRKAKPAKESDEEQEASPAPRETPEPVASSKSKRRHTPTPKPKSAKKKSHTKESSRKKNKKAEEAKSTRNEEETAKPEKTPPARAEERSTASERPTPPPKPLVSAAPTPASSAESKPSGATSSGERAQVVIEKSGLEEDQGLEPPPSPPPRRGFWPWSRRSANYRYLTRSVIDAIRRAPVKRRRWQFIVVHNSGTRQGNARVFDYYHRHVRRMQNGLAYHFVIGNGTSTGNGQIEVGDRWRRQINGGHVHSDYLNNISLGICLVGDFNRDRPTRAQLDSCEELIRYLRDRCGKTDRGAIPVRPHREMNPPRWPTDCPGDDFPYSWFRRF
ncbi:MAG: N-acetylmuramoyl-L-alanine amidase [Verrucomicrobia bacterium]|nr:N-acetylmuramoyl-L-alanine amidase [Verrucomicrobiota bacterium]